jgi:hypothetical protein
MRGREAVIAGLQARFDHLAGVRPQPWCTGAQFRVRTVSHLCLNSDYCIETHVCIVSHMKRLRLSLQIAHPGDRRLRGG